MNLSIEYSKIIYGPKKEILFTFPCDTILDKIILDLWNDIIKYINIPSFAIGLKSVNYQEYRELKDGEFYRYRHEILKYYSVNKGIKNIFNLNLMNAILVINDLQVMTCEGRVACDCDDDKKLITIRHQNELFTGHFTRFATSQNKFFDYVVLMVFDP